VVGNTGTDAVQGAQSAQVAVENNFLNKGRPVAFAEKLKACNGEPSCEQGVRKDMAKESAENIQKLKSCWDAGDSACVAAMRSQIETDGKAYSQLGVQDALAGRSYENSANWYADIIDQCGGKCGWLESALTKTAADGLTDAVYGALGAGGVKGGKTPDAVDTKTSGQTLVEQETDALERIGQNSKNSVDLSTKQSGDIYQQQLEKRMSDPAAYQEALDRIVSTPKGERPDPSTYLSSRYISEHLDLFKDGATKFMPESNFNRYGIAQVDGTSFVMPKTEANNLLSLANGNATILEKALGLDEGFLSKNKLLRVDIKEPKELNLRIPSGNEAGANNKWIPGGRLPNGNSEAIIDAKGLSDDKYTVSSVFSNERK